MQKNKKIITFVFETVKITFYAIILSFFIRSFAYQPFSIPSGSMIPTLLVGDYIFVSKISYGYSKYSFPFSLDLFEGRIFEDEIKRGDVAVFRPPYMPSVDYIKRVVGLPGDVVEINVKSQVFINGIPIQQKFDGNFIGSKKFGYSIVYDVFTETMPNGTEYKVIQRQNHVRWRKPEKFKVPEGHYFMMGDNRDESEDSRGSIVGMVPKQNFIGKAQIVFMSIKKQNRQFSIWKVPGNIRLDRFFNAI